MQILPSFECACQGLIFGKVRKQPQFDLRVIRPDQLRSLGSDKRATDPLTHFGANGDVLEVGIGRRESAGGSRGLMK